MRFVGGRDNVGVDGGKNAVARKGEMGGMGRWGDGEMRRWGEIIFFNALDETGKMPLPQDLIVLI